MNRQEIEKAAADFWSEPGELETEKVASFAIRQINLAIEEAAKIAERGADEGPVYCERPACVAASIRNLKICS